MLNFLFLLFFTFLSNYDDCSPPSSIDDTIPEFKPYPVKGLGSCKGRSHEKKVAHLLDFVQIISPPPPSPQFGQLVQLF